MSFSGIERSFARKLNRFPRAKSALKRAYSELNYRLSRSSFPSVQLTGKSTIATAAEWAGIRESSSNPEFFGYFDISPWDTTETRFLTHRVSGNDATIMLYNCAERTSKELGVTQSWNWQQGARAQWLRTDSSELVVYNTLQQGKLGCVLTDTHAESSFLPWPVQSVAPDGKKYTSLNYLRLSKLRPDYGYDIICDNFSADANDTENGLWEIDVASGAAELLISVQKVASTAANTGAAEHEINHTTYDSSGKSIAFIHRWNGSTPGARIVVLDRATSEPTIILDGGTVSHYCWTDEDTILAYASTPQGTGYHVVNVSQQTIHLLDLNSMNGLGDGHPSLIMGNDANTGNVVTDSYPDRQRRQHLLFVNPENMNSTEIGNFYSPTKYHGFGRCDLHPRPSANGRMISIDSPHSGIRQCYIITVDDELMFQ